MIGSPSLALAFAAGFVSFVSPCVLPLVPGYLATVCGAPTGPSGRVDARVVVRSLLFIGSFSFIFILLGLSATAIGHWLFSSRATLNVVAGVAIIVMGALFVGAVFVTRLNRQWRVPGLLEGAGRGGPAVAGAAFALAWTPCIGPTLGAILGLAETGSGTGHGALLLAVYSGGLAVPFLVSAMFFQRAQRSFGWFRRHHRGVQLLSGAMLIGVGVLVLTGSMYTMNIDAQRFLDGLGWNFFQSV